MAKIQTRRSISINGQLFVRFRQLCRSRGVSMSAYVTRLIEADLGLAQPRRLSAETPNVQTLPKRDSGSPRRSSLKDPFTF
jgi:hypothetical protein